MRLLKSFLVFGCLLFICGGSLVALAQNKETGNGPNTLQELERLAEQLPCFPADDFILNRNPRQGRTGANWTPEALAEYDRLEPSFKRLSTDTNSLVQALNSTNARIRTVALASLFAREDPQCLPWIASLASDGSQTFPAYVAKPPTPLPPDVFEGIGPPPTNQTVGLIASRMVRFYMKAAGLEHFGSEPDTLKDFERYWFSRKERKHCASWWTVRLARGDETVMKEVDGLPRTERAFTMLWLKHVPTSESFHGLPATEAEQVSLAKEIGPNDLLLQLQHRIPCDDPDQNLETGNRLVYRALSMFVLKHARELLRQDQVNALEVCERSDLGPQWALARAQLQPEKAAEILHRRFEQLTFPYQNRDREAIALALWRAKGLEEKDFLIRWFYSEKEEQSTFPNTPAAFLQDLAQDKRPERDKLLASLVAHERFDLLGWQPLKALLEIVNASLSEPLVPKEEIWGVMHRRDEVAHARWREKLRQHFGVKPAGVPAEEPQVAERKAPARRIEVGVRPHGLAFSADGKQLVGSLFDGSGGISSWDPATGNRLWNSDQRVYALSFVSNAFPLALFIWNKDSGKTVGLWDSKMEKPGIQQRLRDTLQTAAFSPDGQLLACGEHNHLYVLSIQSGQTLWETRTAHTGLTAGLAFSPDGKLLVSGGQDHKVKLWRSDTGELLQTMEWHNDMLRAVAFAPDGRQFASGAEDGRVNLWDAGTGKLVKTLLGRQGRVYGVAFSPTNRRLAAAFSDNLVRVWSLPDGRLEELVPCPAGFQPGLVFSPDGTTLATWGSDGVLNLWRFEGN